ncbi:hypothetical protein [Methylobacterium durans]|uniref:EF-hand domain-containing protein n=1 Tax=Methylobacterium durans TaxID=2202825 RepID=A0A2U8W8Z0_9HYPH|nr:hypothetical protein [Methylobacterium durans]AWN42577.1 hypothetical protein DK389_21310 [Methylobacterium durans]
MLTSRELKAADPDRAGTLNKKEFLTVIEQRSRRADADRDGTLDARELGTRPGRSLTRLLR